MTAAEKNWSIHVGHRSDFLNKQPSGSGFDYSVDNESLETLYWLK